MKLVDLVRKFKWAFILTVSLVAVQRLAWLVEPTVFGRLLDALIEAAGPNGEVHHLGLLATVGQWLHTSAVSHPLILWTCVFAINSGAGTIRRSAFEKIYLNMFTNIAVRVTDSCEKQGLDVARTASRVELFRDYVSFLKQRFPDFIQQFFDLGGTVIALYFYDPRLSLTCLCIGVPLLFINRLYNHNIIHLEKELHDLREDVFSIFAKKDRRALRIYYDSTAVPQKKIANWAAVNFGVLRLFLLVIFIVVLFIVIDIDNLSTGQIYAVVAYLWTFVGSIECLPELMESYTSLKDIQGRVHEESLPELL